MESRAPDDADLERLRAAIEEQAGSAEDPRTIIFNALEAVRAGAAEPAPRSDVLLAGLLARLVIGTGGNGPVSPLAQGMAPGGEDYWIR